MLRRAIVLGLVLVTMSLALFALQHRGADGDLHVTTAVMCPVEPAPSPGADTCLDALAGDLLPLVAIVLALPVALGAVTRVRPPEPIPPPQTPALLPAGPLRV